MVSTTKLPLVSAYVNNWNIDGKEINQYVVDFFDVDGASQNKYRHFYCDELFWKGNRLGDEKALRDVVGKEFEITYRTQTNMKKDDKHGVSYPVEKYILISMQLATKK